jgi:hypothetical protein
MAAGAKMRNRLLGRLTFLAGACLWAWRAAELLPGHLHKFNYLDSVDQGLRMLSEWVHPLFVPSLAAVKAGLGLFGWSGSMLAPLAVMNLAAGGITLALLFLLAERLGKDSLLAAAGVLALGFCPAFLTGTLGMNPYALAAAFSTLSLALLTSPSPADERRRYALAGAAAGLTAGLHASGIALAPVAALASWFGPGPTRRKARRLGVFSAALAAAVVLGYAVFLAYHRDSFGPFRPGGTAGLFRGIEQVPGSSLFTSRDIGRQLRDFHGNFPDGAFLLLFLSALALLRGALRRWGAAAGLSPAQRQGALLAAVCSASYALFFIISSSTNGFAYASLLPVPALFAVLAGGAPWLRLPAVSALLAAAVLFWGSAPSSFAAVRGEALFLDGLLKSGDVLVLPGRPLPDLLYLRDFPILQAGADSRPVRSVAPVLPPAALTRTVGGILARGRRVFFQAGDAEARFPDGQEGIDFAVRRRQLFAVDGAGSEGQERWVGAVKRRLAGSFAMDCRYRSAQGWEYCRLRLRRGVRSGPAGAAEVRTPLTPAEVAALSDALLSLRRDPFVPRKTRYLLGWLERFPEDVFIQEQIAALAAEHAEELGPLPVRTGPGPGGPDASPRPGFGP